MPSQKPPGRTSQALRALLAQLGRLGLTGIRALHAALGLYLFLSLVLAAFALWGFAALAEEVLESDTERFDEVVLTWIVSYRTGWLDRVALEVTPLGSAVVLYTAAVIVSVLLWHLGRKHHVALIWIAATGALALNQVMKLAFGRPRPEVEWLVPVGSLSFPSGHAMNAAVFYTVIAYSIGQIVGKTRGRTLVHALGILALLLVGWSRIYVGVHHPTDVIAGYAVGYAWAILCAVLIGAWFRLTEDAPTETPSKPR